MDPPPINDEVHKVLDLIESQGLPYPSGQLLGAFVTEALNPIIAAHYVKSRLQLGQASSLVANWSYIIESITQKGSPPPKPDDATRKDIIKRDGNRCCITGKSGSRCDPLLVEPILPVPDGWLSEKEGGVNDMLGAFFGPPYRDWWLSYAETPEFTSAYANHWLVKRSGAKAFAQGLVKLDRRQPSMIEYKLRHVEIKPDKPIQVDGTFPLLGDHSRNGIETVDPRFIGTHARLAKAIQFLDISKNLAPGNGRPPKSRSGVSCKVLLKPLTALSSLLFSAFLGTWGFVPGRLRFATYGMLHKFGGLWYQQEAATVQRLPFGLYLKNHHDPVDIENEFNALRVVGQNTSIPVPEALDWVSSGKRNHDPYSDEPGAYLLTTRIPGLPLSRCLYVLSDRDCEDIATQLKNYVAQLRDIPNPYGPDNVISNTLGQACRDTRICGARPVGPFPDEASFSQMVRFSDDPARRGHKIVFTHADLNPRNIMVDRVVGSDGSAGWAVTGIIDWESAGQYPEYWEYTKSLFEGFRWPQRYNDMIHNVFGEFGDYAAEVEVERRSWEAGDAV
ncbi:hypothetical protein QBC38DRAFT_490472 [Podospora fimiseda]|uniref:Aminoglycoside phosphotransferase domain-containing protein n=1 Tax=Podospora fimiseda TaxID=252190 RepID=A0AAN6YPP1_9PEZI|nr:hypothetical protein QBC38DRAFT_490472 [Podospora fimiseda]